VTIQFYSVDDAVAAYESPAAQEAPQALGDCAERQNSIAALTHAASDA
jgi:hypothetical protein